MITFKSKADVQTVEDVYAEVNARYIAALMFHDQMADYFDFLGLHGYKRLHEHQYYEESRERRKLNRYYINHHGRLIPDRFTGTVNMIPDGWLTANRISVGRSTKQKAVEDGFNAYREWEAETKKLYENCNIPFHRTERSPVNHYRTMFLVIATGVFEFETFRQVVIHLYGSQLPTPADGIFNNEIEIKTIECSFTIFDSGF